MSSPRVNTLVAFGCALSFIAIILLGLDSVSSHTKDWLCKVILTSLSTSLYYNIVIYAQYVLTL